MAFVITDLIENAEASVSGKGVIEDETNSYQIVVFPLFSDFRPSLRVIK